MEKHPNQARREALDVAVAHMARWLDINRETLYRWERRATNPHRRDRKRWEALLRDLERARANANG